MPKSPRIHTAKNGRKYVRTESGRARFISKEQEEALRAGTLIDVPTTAPSANVRVRGRYEMDFNERQLGWILRGFIETARGRTDDLARLFGPDDEAAHERKQHKLLLELGEELYQHTGPALRFFDVTAEEWASWFPRLRDRVTATVMPNAPAPTLNNLTWLPPVVGRISSRFGVQREKGRHAGIDIAVPTGTPVIAPLDLKIEKVGFADRPGRFVTALVVREDGSFADDGYRVTFAHLSQANVQEGQIVQRGSPIGLSGATGNVTGPHLHFRVQWVDDGYFTDDVVAIDPLALIPEDVITGKSSPRPVLGGAAAALKQGQPVNVIVAPEAGRVSIGSGIIQPDTDVRVGNVSATSAPVAPQQEDTQFASFSPADVLDPLAGIVTTVGDITKTVVNPQTLQAAAGLVSAGSGIVGTVFPKAAPVAIPVSLAAGAVGSAVGPASQAVEAAGDLIAGEDPLVGILT